jgi:transcription-repair coupling factor (superfamily II helicase)
LELRGAGNILGTQQSGHIATVGYELYCQLLEQAVLQLKKLPPKKTIDVDLDLPGQAYIPPGYVPDMRLKIDLYRRLARVASQAELDDLKSELTDRFGPWPAEVEHLLTLAQLRIWAHLWQIRSIHLEPGYAVFTYAKRSRIEQLAVRSSKSLRIVDERTAYLPLGKELSSPEALMIAIKSLLQAEETPAYNPPRAARSAAG